MGAGQRPNKLGWITNMSWQTHRDLIDVSSFMNPREFIAGAISYEADLHIVATDPGALMEQFQEWMRSGINAPIYQKEFMCLYCGSPNKIEHTHCTKCGAPRSFVIG